MQLKKRFLKTYKMFMFSVINMLQAIKEFQKCCQLMKYLGVADQDVADAEIIPFKINLIEQNKKKPNLLE